MNKVLNWTIGSFFRTIGRLIAFIVAGIAIAYILSISDIDIPNIFRHALFMDVKAKELSYRWNTGWRTETNNNFTSLGDYMIYSPVNRTDYVFYSSGMGNDALNVVGYDQILFNFYIRSADLQNNPLQTVNIAGQYWNGSYISNGPCTINEYLFAPRSADEESDVYFSAICDIPTGQTYFRDLVVTYNIANNGNAFNTFGFGKIVNLVKSDTKEIINSQNENTQAITNQTQQDQEQHEELMDSNTTQAEDDAEDFFESFDAPDVGGLSAIITAPLSTIQSLLNATCTNLVLPLPFVNENLTLPCMNDIYTQHFGAFFSLYQTIILGIIAYRCIRSIFFDLQGFANPSDDRIEVMDL